MTGDRGQMTDDTWCGVNISKNVSSSSLTPNFKEAFQHKKNILIFFYITLGSRYQ